MDIEINRHLVGKEFDVSSFEVSTEEIVQFATFCGDTDPRFTDPTHPDFQAPPTLTAKYTAWRMLPERFRPYGQRGFDAGKCVSVLGPIRPGDTLTAHSQLADIYEKTGRSGPMVFIVHRMEFENQRGEPVAVVDWRLVQQPDPEPEAESES